MIPWFGRCALQSKIVNAKTTLFDDRGRARFEIVAPIARKRHESLVEFVLRIMDGKNG